MLSGVCIRTDAQTGKGASFATSALLSTSKGNTSSQELWVTAPECYKSGLFASIGHSRVEMAQNLRELLRGFLELALSPALVARADRANKGSEHVIALWRAVAPGADDEIADGIREQLEATAAMKAVDDVAVGLEEHEADGEVLDAKPCTAFCPGRRCHLAVLIYQRLDLPGEDVFLRLEVAVEGHARDARFPAQLCDTDRGQGLAETQAHERRRDALPRVFFC